MKKANNDVEYNYDSDFPRILRGLMEERGTTQDALAKICGVKRQSIAQWKDGNTRPDIVSLRKISEFYEVTTDYLLGLTPNPTTDKATKELCETLGLSDIAIHFLQDNSKQSLRDVINFLFGHYYEVRELWENVEGEVDEDTEKLCTQNILGYSTILSEFSKFLSICKAKKDVKISLNYFGELKINSYALGEMDTLAVEDTNIKDLDIYTSLMELSAKTCIENINDILKEILRNSIIANVDIEFVKKANKQTQEIYGNNVCVIPPEILDAKFKSSEYYTNKKMNSSELIQKKEDT